MSPTIQREEKLVEQGLRDRKVADVLSQGHNGHK